MRLATVVAAAALGTAVVGPALNLAVMRWVGRCVIVASLLGWAPAWADVAPAPARCGGCGGSLEVGVPGDRSRALALAPYVVTAGRRCRVCGTARPRWPALVELATGALFGLAAARLGWSAELPAVLALVAGLVAVSAVDLVSMRIPTRFVRVTGLAAAAAMAAATVGGTPARALGGAAVGAALYGAFLGALYLASPAMLGFGDVRLGVLIGAVLGWVAWTPDRPVAAPIGAILGAAFMAGVVGSAAGVVLLAVRRRNHPFPFGPAMAVGALATLLAVA